MYLENLVEVHSHILPGIDDGAPDVETSLKMIELLKNQGAKKIVLTPHYYSDNISLDDFLRKRYLSFNLLLSKLPPQSPELYPAAEVYISKYLFNAESLDELKIANSDYILIEHSFSANFDGEDYNRLINMYCDYGAKPILAHIERYPALLEDTYKIEQYVDMGCLIQSNVSAFSDAPRGIRRKLIKLMNAGLIHVIGSDCHNLTTRAPEYGDGIEMIIKKCGEDSVKRLINNANILVK